MIRRPLVGVTVLWAALLLAACNGSPEAGRVTPAPTTSSPTTTPTVSTPTPAWTKEELAAIAAAKARYIAARAAVEKALQDPTKFKRDDLEKAGNGGSWIITVIDEALFQRNNGWYQSGSLKILSTAVKTVKLKIEQPEVDLTTCIDSSAVVTRFQKNHKPVPMGPGNGSRHKFKSRLVFAPPAPGGQKMWFLIDDKATGPC